MLTALSFLNILDLLIVFIVNEADVLICNCIYIKSIYVYVLPVYTEWHFCLLYHEINT